MVLTMMQIYAMTFAELNPLDHDSWTCVDPVRDRNCMKLMRSKDQMKLEEFTHEFCQLKRDAWNWTRP